MKSPAEIADRLARQWHQAGTRSARLLNAGAWPVELPIGKPTARRFADDTAAVRRHVLQWQAVSIGEVLWASANYRAGAEPVRLPTHWVLRTPSEWVAAASDKTVRHEFTRLEHLIENVDTRFWELLIRQRSLWREKSDRDVIDAARLATSMSPGCAKGKPMRLLSDYGVDTKFFERHERLLIRLLDECFDGAAGEQGLAGFLDAREDKDHWLLVAPLDDGLLPFHRQRVPASELARSPLPSSRILVVENEQCLHLLPRLGDTVAVLGAGRNLLWLQAEWLKGKQIGYWGDMDSWGLVMLAHAREHQPGIAPLMMNQTLFNRHASRYAVNEPTSAGQTAPDRLTEKEKQFYRFLIAQERGRLEQEYLPKEDVHQALTVWIESPPAVDIGI